MPRRCATYKLPAPLDRLVKLCEIRCTGECCGLEAFDFSAGEIDRATTTMGAATDAIIFADLLRALDRVDAEVARLYPDARGWICSIEGINQYLTLDTFKQLTDSLRVGVQTARDRRTTRPPPPNIPKRRR
jgi:hypothetical protein